LTTPETAGWVITNKAQVSTEEATSDGRAELLTTDSRSRPLAILEAKRFTVTLRQKSKQRLTPFLSYQQW